MQSSSLKVSHKLTADELANKAIAVPYIPLHCDHTQFIHGNYLFVRHRNGVHKSTDFAHFPEVH